MPPADKSIYDVDWVLSDTSNVHIATSREWFDTYTSLTSTVHDRANPERSHPAIGIGSVSIPVKPYANKPGSNTITLSGVLHVPHAFSNVVCISLLKADYEIEGCAPEWEDSWIRHKQTAGGRKLGIVEVPVLPKLRLKGQPSGHTSLENESCNFEGLLWPLNEVEKWEKESGRKAITGEVDTLPKFNQSLSKKKDSSTGGKNRAGETEALPTSNQSLSKEQDSSIGLEDRVPFTYKERRWMEGGYGGAKEFLQKYSITDPKEAKRLVRDIMYQCDDDEDVTEARIKAREMIEMDREYTLPESLKEAVGLARMMLQAAPGNCSFIDQRDDSDSETLRY
ncbi:hypothetical protein MMC10_001320 [Thelotrema lepadinum]|nr:hypothetical protein [Thelotrema lepadinum]